MILPEKTIAGTVNGVLRQREEKVRGKIVMAGKHTIVPVDLNPAGQAPDR